MEGTVREIDGRYVLRFERHLNHPVEKVWAALTEPGQLVAWLTEADIELVEGGRVELRWQNTDEYGNVAVLHGTITQLDPPRVLQYDSDIHGVLRWELLADGAGGCVLTFTSTLPAPADRLSETLAGWHVHLDHLADALAGHRVHWPTWTRDHWDRWVELRDRYADEYAEMFG